MAYAVKTDERLICDECDEEITICEGCRRLFEKDQWIKCENWSHYCDMCRS